MISDSAQQVISIGAKSNLSINTPLSENIQAKSVPLNQKLTATAEACFWRRIILIFTRITTGGRLDRESRRSNRAFQKRAKLRQGKTKEDGLAGR